MGNEYHMLMRTFLIGENGREESRQMMSSTFLAVPLKSTNEVDLAKPLISYIETIYQTSNDLSSEIKEAVQELNKLRNKACNQPLDKHQSALDVLTRYYDQLVAIENKLPITAAQNPIAFKWKDAFDKGSLFFSKASLTHQKGNLIDAHGEKGVLEPTPDLMPDTLAALSATMLAQAQEAIYIKAEKDKMKPTALVKIASQCAEFYQEAQKHAHRDNLRGLFDKEPTPDLMPDTLAALSATMLAQAQEAIYIKAEKDKMKPTALVKIASQCAEFYQEAQKHAHRDNLRGLFDKEWVNTVTGKSLAMSALAQYHQAMVNADAKEIGEQLSRLTEAQSLMNQANSYLPSSTFATQTALIQKAYTAAKKDNDFIYHERVADFRSLPALPKAALAKPLPVNFPMTPRFKDMFSSLVPVQVHSALASYDARKAELINMETGRLREYTQIMNGILASQNLPAALDDATNQEALPESIRQKSSKVKALGGIDAVTSMIADLPNLYKRNQEILDETLRLLNEEKESDDRLRAQFKEKWTRMGSERLTAPLHQEVGKYRGILQAATNADQIVKQKMEENREAIKLLSLAEPELRAAIPGLDPKAANKNSEAVQKLRALMDTVQEIKVEREQLEKEFADVHCDMTSAFLKAMADSQILNEEQLSTAKINEIYGPLREKVSESIKKQESCLAEVELWNKKFCAEKAGSSGAAERERILKMLANGHDKYVEIKSNLQEGTKFYNDLTPLLVRLQQKVSDFCFARQTEKEDLMKQLQQNIVSGLEACAAVAAKKVQRHLDEIASKVNISGLMEGSSSSSSSAPPRPPPPKVSQSSSNPFDVVDEAPIPPPRNVNALHATNEPSKASAPNAPVTQAPPAYQPQQYNPQFGQPQQQQQFPSYAQPMPTQPMPGQPVPFMYTPQVPYMQPQFNQNYTTPYPIAYPGTYPGAFNPHGYGQFPPQPQHPQWGNPPTSQ
ncbi:Apoptosis-linked protein [Toxocara canis]|uniref:Apoptosis-linked protein n=1 Tax=Toxocara canis TaxID=6265 RepID=A0A0B2VG39_TOXCA|nr:Apoptosis-linked protein [Toxocara canis]